MTKLPFCLQPSKPSDNNDYESYKKGEFELEEWEDVNYCEHSFNHGDDGLTDREVVDLLYAQNKEIEQLTKLLILIADAESIRSENSVKEILRNTLFGLDTVAGESPNAFKEYSILNKFFKEHYKEHWDNDKYD